VKIFAPKEYYEAIWIIPPVTMSVFFNFAYTFFATFEFYYEKKSYISLATLIGAVLNVLLNYIFIGIFGYYAAGYTTLFCYILYAVFHYIFMRKICKEYLDNRQPYSMKVLLQITLLFIGIGFGIMMTYNNSTIRYGLIAVMVMLLFRRRRNIAEIINKIIGLKRGNI
jgi:O-antigen/teichoic acid export membrane protein